MRQVTRQRQIVADLECRGQDVSVARALFDQLSRPKLSVSGQLDWLKDELEMHLTKG